MLSVKTITAVLLVSPLILLTACSNDAPAPKTEAPETVTSSAPSKTVVHMDETISNAVATTSSSVESTVTSAVDKALHAANEATSAILDATLGKQVYESSCAACHNIGVMGAPKIDDKEGWNNRTQNGVEPLVKNAIFGVGRMKPKGGKANLTNDEVEAAVIYMIDSNK